MHPKTISAVRFLFLLLGGGPGVLWAHGGDYPRPTGEELAQIQPPLEGAAPFARELSEQGRTLLNEEQLKRLNEAATHYRYMENIQAGRYPNIQPRDAEYHRWRGDQALRGLIESGAPSWRLDFAPGATPPELHRRLDFDGFNHHLMWAVKMGEGPLRFVLQDLSLKSERYAKHRTLTVAAQGTTCFLLRLRDVPTETATVAIQIRKAGQPRAFSWHSLTVNPAAKGQLAVEVFDGEQPAPALVRLRSLPSGALWAPQGALDLTSQLHDVSQLESPPRLDIYGPMGSFELRVPGRFAGHYWVLPAGFEMAVPAGEWELTVWRGIETTPIQRTVSVAAGQWTRERLDLERWTDMAARGWYSGDDHVHAQMLGSADAGRLLAFTRAMDIRVSNILAMGDSQRTYYAQRGFGPEFRAAEHGYWLVPGQEDPRSMLGHNIGLNLTSFARDLDRYLLLDWLATEIHAQGGLFGQTHVGQNVCEAHRGMALMLPFEVYDFCSIMQGGLGTELYYDALDLGFRLTATAGSDMPYGGVLGDVRVYAHLGMEPFSPDAWFDAVRAGHTYVSNGPMLEFTVNEAIPGETISVSDDTPLRVEARAWGLAGESAPVELEIVSLSEVVGKARRNSDGETSLSLRMELSPGEGRWIVARARGENGSAAHTTPVWVQRGENRHWNLTRVDAVINKQLAALDEIESVIKDVEQRDAAGQLSPFDFWDRLILKQAESVRDLVRRSRNRYEILRQQARRAAESRMRQGSQ
ncbi:MAG: hypothetical protein CMJ58_07885 [Planctomycetaceae bacterium]|nr:hypothetical protein [Planctomycetaceae bacterium]